MYERGPRDISPLGQQVEDLKASNALQKSISDLEKFTFDYKIRSREVEDRKKELERRPELKMMGGV